MQHQLWKSAHLKFRGYRDVANTVTATTFLFPSLCFPAHFSTGASVFDGVPQPAEVRIDRAVSPRIRLHQLSARDRSETGIT